MGVLGCRGMGGHKKKTSISKNGIRRGNIFACGSHQHASHAKALFSHAKTCESHAKYHGSHAKCGPSHVKALFPHANEYVFSHAVRMQIACNIVTIHM